MSHTRVGPTPRDTEGAGIMGFIGLLLILPSAAHDNDKE